MKTFTFSCHVTVSACTKVQARTQAEALVIAQRRSVELGGVGAPELSEEAWVIEEADGEPKNITVDD